MPVSSERRIERRSRDFVARVDKPQERKGKPPTIGQRLLSLKVGAYWTVEELTAIKASKDQTVEMRSKAGYALYDIGQHGNDALSHLCLDGLFHNALRRGKVATISALEGLLRNGHASAIKDGGLSGIIGMTGMQAISDRLALFHQRLAKEQPAQSSASSPPS